MDVFVYGCDQKEEGYLTSCAKRYQLHIAMSPYPVSVENVADCAGCTCISVLSTPLPKEVLEALYEQGVRFISTRTIGYDHIDIKTCKRLGMQVANVCYAPESVADYTIMLMLMSLRKMKLIMKSAEVQDYSFSEVEGRNLKDRTVGVIGTGAIGTAVIQHLQGFGCHILANTPHPNKDLETLVRYVSLETLLAQSDIITLHLPLFEDTRHIINHTSIQKMKDGVLLINTARGGLVDNEALIIGIEKGKIGGAALDVVEGESGIYYNSQKGRVLPSRDMAILNSYPNVILSPHMAFLCEESTRDMVINSMNSCSLFLKQEADAHRIC